MSEPRILIIPERGEQFECSFAEFVRDNSFEPEEIADLSATLARGESWRDGGGAAPMYEIRKAPADRGRA